MMPAPDVTETFAKHDVIAGSSACPEPANRRAPRNLGSRMAKGILRHSRVFFIRSIWPTHVMTQTTEIALAHYRPDRRRRRAERHRCTCRRDAVAAGCKGLF